MFIYLKMFIYLNVYLFKKLLQHMRVKKSIKNLELNISISNKKKSKITL